MHSLRRETVRRRTEERKMALLRAFFTISITLGTFAMGVATLAKAQSAEQEIVGLLLFLISALFLCTAFIVSAIEQNGRNKAGE
jgi:hypothetical protein